VQSVGGIYQSRSPALVSLCNLWGASIRAGLLPWCPGQHIFRHTVFAYHIHIAGCFSFIVSLLILLLFVLSNIFDLIWFDHPINLKLDARWNLTPLPLFAVANISEKLPGTDKYSGSERWRCENRGAEGMECGGGVTYPVDYGVWGSVVSSPSGVRPPPMHFGHIVGTQNASCREENVVLTALGNCTLH